MNSSVSELVLCRERATRCTTHALSPRLVRTDARAGILVEVLVLLDPVQGVRRYSSSTVFLTFYGLQNVFRFQTSLQYDRP